MAEFTQHKLYQACEMQEADAVAYAFADVKSTVRQFPFKFPELSDDDVRIKIQYTGLCHSDCMHARGLWGQVMYPSCPGHEVVGQISMVGKNVQKFKIGDTVGACPQRNFCEKCEHCQRGNNNLCTSFQGLYGLHFGGYATHIQLPSKMTFFIPEGLPLNKISPLLCAGVTVFAPLKRWFDQHGKPGMKIGIFGIGGLGHLALQYASKLGLDVTAFTTSFEREQEMKDFGANQLSHSTDVESLNKMDSTMDCILNTLFLDDKQQFMAMQRVLKKGGTLLQVGLPPTDVELPISIMTLVFKQLNFQGSIIGSYESVDAMLQFSNQHKIYPVVQEFQFEDFAKAFDLLENGKPRFRAVVNVQDWAKKNGFDK